MEISNNSVVSIHYRLTNDQNEEIDNSAGGEPLIYMHGAGDLIDGLEEALTGKQVGESFTVSIPPAEGYGEEEADLIRIMQMDEFNGVEMREGMQLQGKDPDGTFRLLRVVKVDGDEVTINMNHPLAGMVLHFEVNVDAVRPATDEEIEAGQIL
jgi:FKBP-type peptidyl-prolyl cis-trans isomerase SlyD